MTKYLKHFETTSEYESYIGGGEALLPNVSYVEEDKGLKYNPYVAPPKDFVDCIHSLYFNGIEYDIPTREEGDTDRWVNVTDSSFYDYSTYPTPKTTQVILSIETGNYSQEDVVSKLTATYRFMGYGSGIHTIINGQDFDNEDIYFVTDLTVEYVDTINGYDRYRIITPLSIALQEDFDGVDQYIDFNWDGNGCLTGSISIGSTNKVQMSSITITPSSLTLNENETKYIQITYAPSNAYFPMIDAEVIGNPKHVSIDNSRIFPAMMENVQVTALSSGTNTLLFEYDDNPSISATCQVAVAEQVNVQYIKVYEVQQYDDVLITQGDLGVSELIETNVISGSEYFIICEGTDIGSMWENGDLEVDISYGYDSGSDFAIDDFKPGLWNINSENSPVYFNSNNSINIDIGTASTTHYPSITQFQNVDIIFYLPNSTENMTLKLIRQATS